MGKLPIRFQPPNGKLQLVLDGIYGMADSNSDIKNMRNIGVILMVFKAILLPWLRAFSEPVARRATATTATDIAL